MARAKIGFDARRIARGFALGAAAAIAGAAMLTPAVFAATSTQDLGEGVTPTDLAQELAGPGVTVSNVEYTGSELSAGLFTETDPAVFGFEDGVVLSTGAVGDIVGPNELTNATSQLGTPGDEQLSELAGYDTLDATVLAFDFVPVADTVYISYVFASEEYSEFANGDYNDVFAFFVNGENCALTDSGDPVSVNTINGGNPDDGSAPVRPDLFRDNTEGQFDMEPDGLTVVLVCDVGVNADAVNTMRLAIADGTDDNLDSWVLLAAEGISTEAPVVPLAASLVVGAEAVQAGDDVVVTATVDNPNGTEQQITRLSLDLPAGLDFVPGSATVLGEPQVAGTTLSFADAGTIPAGGRLTFTFAVTPSAAGSATIGISGETASGAVITAGAVDVTAVATPPPPPPFPWTPVLAVAAGAAVLAGAAATAAANTPRARQSRLLRKHVKLAPRQDTVGRYASAPASDAPKTPPAPTFRLVARQGTVEHTSTLEERT